MIKNYFKIAWRNLLKNKLFSAIKIGGFAFSIAACVLIGLYIQHETSYDKSYTDSDQLYRAVMSVVDEQGSLRKQTSFSAPFARTMEANFPEIEASGRILPSPLFGAGSNQVSTLENQESLYEEGIVYADQGLMEVIQLPVVYGEPRHLLDEPNTVVLTASKAARYFQEDNPVGKIIFLNNDKTKPYTVKGVLADIPDNSHLYGLDFFLSLAGEPFYPGEQSNWLSNNYVSYFKIRKGTNLDDLQKKLTADVMNNYQIPQSRAAGAELPEWLVNSLAISFQSLSAIHLHSHDIRPYSPTDQNNGDIRFVWLFGGVAGFILLIACVNFINLSTARSSGRSREIGLRKTIGAQRSGLIRQFLTESTIYSFLSILLGLLLAWLFLSLFNQLAGKQLLFPWKNPWLLPLSVLSVLVIGLIAGLYPAFYLSGFQPIDVLKGKRSQASQKSKLRNGLVVFQFTSSIILIVGTLIINSQMQFILNRKVGFEKDQVVVIQGTSTLGDRVQALRQQLQKLPEVQHVTVGDYLPVRMSGVKRNGNTIWNEGKGREESPARGQFWQIDEDYLPALGIKLISGRNFSEQLATDTDAAIINQRLARLLNLEDPIGKRITNGGKDMLVIGLVEDFNFESMREEVGGVVLTLGSSPSMMAVKLNGSHTKGAVERITEIWKEFLPGQAIRYTFMDESYAHMYENVQRTGSIFTSFALLAILIACLGLFGLAAFTSEQRRKEIGVRKVLGATVSGVVALLSVDFLKPVLIAFVIASPIAYLAMGKWLEDFAYRVDIQWWMFAVAGLAAVVIALLTVSWQAVRAAVTNPVKSLRNE